MKAINVAYFSATMQKDQDGVARVLYHWIERFEKNNMHCIFFSPSLSIKKQANSRIYKVPSVPLPMRKTYRLALPGFFFKKKLDKFKPDLMHINCPDPSGTDAIAYARKHHIPIVATYHTHFTSYLKYYKMEMLEPFIWSYLRKLYNDCDRVYVPSIPVMKELKANGFRNLVYMPHGVESRSFNKSFRSESWRKELGLKGEIALLYVGRLVWEKDLDILAKAYNSLHKRKNVKFIIVGEGPIMDELKTMMPSAIFLGKLTGKNLATAYASSDIFVFPSTTETFGNVILEAMISGIPCVCANVGGPKGIIKDGFNGMLAKPHDAKDFEKKIVQLIKHPKQREKIADNGLEYANSQTWDKVCHKLFKDYRDVIKKKVK